MPTLPLTVTVTLPAGTTPESVHAPLALYWLTASEAADIAAGKMSMALFFALCDRIKGVPTPDLHGGAGETITVPAGPIHVYAVVDVAHDLLKALSGDGGDGDFIGDAATTATPDAPARVTLPLTRRSFVPSPPTHCKGAREHLETLASPAPANAPPSIRHVCVHLPESYEASTRRYPVVYVLPGLFSDESAGSIRRIFTLADAAHTDVIFVGVDTHDDAGSTYLNDSPRTGAFEAFLPHDVVTLVDAHYRTETRPESRGVMGQSTGGFNAVSIAFRHPETFGVIAASSPDGLDLASWLLDRDGQHVSKIAHTFLRLEAVFGPPGQMSSYAADWSPNPAAPFGLDWPADPTTGQVRPDIMRRWLTHSPSEALHGPAANALRARFTGSIYLAAGKADEFGLFAPTKLFSEELTAVGIENVFAPDDAGHSGPDQRVRAMLAFLSGRFSPEGKRDPASFHIDP